MSLTNVVFVAFVAAQMILCCQQVFADEATASAASDDIDSEKKLARDMEFFRNSFINEANTHPQLYDAEDVEEFVNDPTGWASIRFMEQRSNDWKRAYWLAVNTYRWRAKMGIRQLRAQQFPCNLFNLGLIFESGVGHQLTESGEYVPTSPVIWIRLGALGGVVKHLEGFSAKRIVSFGYNSGRSAISKTRDLFHRGTHKNVPRTKSGRQPLIENMSVKDNITINYVLKSIAWWLEDWRRKHPAGSTATLVLDFENTDDAFSSWTLGEFFTSLDDYFPALFDQIIGFRYKAKLWSIRSPISMFTRIFTSRIATSPETDRKLKFVTQEPKIDRFMPRVDVYGKSVLPKYLSGECTGAINESPAGCQADTNYLASQGLYDPALWQAIYNEFYRVCRPKYA